MISTRRIAGIALLGAMLVSACSTAPRKPSPASIEPIAPVPQAGRPAGSGPPDFNSIPDAVPKIEPRSRRGNPPFYDVLGRRYAVLPNAQGYVERGVASWYGPGFHLGATSVGDSYDMYGMTAAHKTLPLPCYARVTNLSNG